MKSKKPLCCALLAFAWVTGARGQEVNDASAFVPGCYQSYEMVLVGEDGALNQVSLVSTANQQQVVNGLTYKVLDAGELGLGQLCFRQEDGRVYRLDADGQHEVLCYDFTLKAGDEFVSPDGTEWTVLSSRDTLMNLPMREQFSTHLLTLSQKANPQVQDTWQEGVGSWHYGPFTPDLLQSYAHVAMLGCLMNNQTFSFDRSPLWSRFLGLPHAQMPADEEEQNPLSSGDSLVWTLRGDSLHVRGRVLRSASSRGLKAWCYLHDGVASLYIEPVPTMSYMPLRYDVDLCVPCHGERVAQVEVRGATLPSSIASSVMTSQPCVIYDLQGRKVEGKPSRGIYIIGGKKRVVE